MEVSLLPDVPVITVQPRSVSLGVNNSGCVLSVEIAEPCFPRPEYEWFRNGVRILSSDASASALSLSVVSASTAGAYSCRVCNTGGSCLSDVAVVALVGRAPEVTTAQEDVEVALGHTMRIAVEVAADPEATLQWSRNGVSLPGKTSAQVCRGR